MDAAAAAADPATRGCAARRSPTGAGDASRQTRLAGGRQPVGEVRDLEVPRRPTGRCRPGSTRRGSPGRRDRGPRPLLVFLHGGGMVFGDLDTHDATCRLLAERADVRVLALDYRLAPEHPLPGRRRRLLGRLPVGGRARRGARRRPRPDRGRRRLGRRAASRRGRALKAAEAGVPCALPAAGLPGDGLPTSSESRRLFGEGFFLTSEFMDLARRRLPRRRPRPARPAGLGAATPRRSPRSSRPPSSSPPASTRCATRARPTPGCWPSAGVAVELSATRADPRVPQHGRRRSAATGPPSPRSPPGSRAACRPSSRERAYCTWVSAARG